MSATVTITVVTPANVGLLEQVAEDVFDAPIDREYVSAWAVAANHIALVAVSDGWVIGQMRGSVQLQPDGAPAAMIDNLGVAPAFQRQRVATRLWHAFGREAIRSGAAAIYVLTEPDNAAALAFYTSLGLSRSSAVMFETSSTLR